MRVTLSLGRFGQKEFIGFLKSMQAIGNKSRQKTEAEKRTARLEWSMKNDCSIQTGRPHGDDVLSVSVREKERILVHCSREIRALELETLKEEAEALRTLLMAREARIAELDSERGSGVFHKRQAEIREMRQRMEQAG